MAGLVYPKRGELILENHFTTIKDSGNVKVYLYYEKV